jgi:glucosamine-6-phosphate isomerase
MRPEHIRTVVLDDPAELARSVATRIATIVRERTAGGGRAVLGLATGATPIGVYRELINMHRGEGLSFAGVVSFNLDEYYPVEPASIQSYHRFMWENLFSHVDIDSRNVHIPDGTLSRDEVPAFCNAYEAAIQQAGGISFQLLGIGKTGHIGFNEPGSGPQSRTRLITLDTITRRDAAGDFSGEDNVPREDDPRRSRDRDTRDRGAQGRHRAARRRGPSGHRGCRHIPPASSERDVLPRRRGGCHAHADGDVAPPSASTESSRAPTLKASQQSRRRSLNG